jgi:hypothetical protein
MQFFNLRRRGTMVTIAIGAGMLIAGCSRPAEVHYRVTVDVNDHGVIRSGSSVWSFALAKSMLPIASPYNYRFRGEAIAVDLPGRGTLFALVKNVEMYPEYLFGDLQSSRQGGRQHYADRIEDLGHIKTMVGTRAELNCTNPPQAATACPMFVRFRDIDDPNSVERVDPQDLAESFGSDAWLKRVSVEITDAPLTTGIRKKLRWLDALRGGYLNGASTSRTAPLGLHAGDFSTEVSY